jgi:predicted GNAT family acetyltransferase
MGNPVTFSEAPGRYEMREGGHIVLARVRRERDIVFIDYVEAPPALRGTGAAGRFMDGLMRIMRAENLRVVPLCGYAATWLQRHSEYHDLKA